MSLQCLTEGIKTTNEHTWDWDYIGIYCVMWVTDVHKYICIKSLFCGAVPCMKTIFRYLKRTTRRTEQRGNSGGKRAKQALSLFNFFFCSSLQLDMTCKRRNNAALLSVLLSAYFFNR